MANIILVTHWTGGDVYPFIRFGKLLKKEGHDVTLLTHCVYEEKAKAAGLKFLAVDTPEEYECINRDLSMLADPIGNRDDYVRFHTIYHGKTRLLREVELIEKVMTPDSVIIARHRSSISGLLAAEKHHLPYASMILAPNYFSHMELHDQLFGSAFCEEINSARKELGLSPISGWKDWLYSPKQILCGWPDWYAKRDETWPDSAVPIGFIPDPDEKGIFDLGDEVLAFRDEAEKAGKKFVIITGGSSRMVSSDFYTTAIDACKCADVFAVVVTPYKEYIPEEMPENIKWVKNVSLRDLMKRSDLVIHHGGMGTINEAIDAAVPQIVLPHLTDGPDNADRLAALGIAMKFAPKMWDASRIADSIKSQLSEDSRELCIRFRDMNQETYLAKIWLYLIPKMEPYTLPENLVKKASDGTETAELEGAGKTSAAGREVAGRQVSRELLLKILKKKQESQGKQN